MKRTLLAASIAAALTMYSVAQVGAQTYTFKKVAESTFPDNFGVGFINNGGTVAFVGQVAGNPGLYIGNSVPLTEVDYGNPNVFPANNSPSLDLANNGDIAFRGATNMFAPGIYKVSGGTLTDLTAGLGAPNFSDLPSINDNGLVAFFAVGPGGSTIYTSDGVTRTPLVNTAGEFAGFQVVSLNDSGTVAFSAAKDGSLGSTGVYVTQGGTVTTIADSTTPGFLGAFGPSINNAGDVAFGAVASGGGSGLYRSSGGVITPYNITGVSYASGPYINSSGSVAFVGQAPQNGIYTTHAAGIYEVISVGDALFGSTLANLAFNQGYNDSGQVTFMYQLADGRRGVAVATPVPEPAGALLMGISVAAILHRRKLVDGHRKSTSSRRR
jgi:hypothetical protein